MIGPLADNQHDMLGPWWGKGVDTDAVSVFDGIAAQSPGATYAQGCKLENLEPPNIHAGQRVRLGRGLRRGGAGGEQADQVVLALGENREMSGEAAARSRSISPAARSSSSRRSRRPASRSWSSSSTGGR